MNKVILITLSFLCLGLAAFSARSGVRMKVKDFVSPPPHIERFSIGTRPQMADVLWIRTIQDFDYCEQFISKNTCKGQSWLFHMLDAIVTLDPKYNIAYSAGGLALTVLISDYDGASRIFDKGVAEFPKDWILLYRAAYHALYEENDWEKASDLYRRAAENGGPEWGVSLAKRLRTKAGKLEIGERMLAQLIQRDEDEAIIERFKEKLEAVRNSPE